MALVRGMTKVRNEAHIIQDTLDTWVDVCNGGVHVYCDCCEDETAEICRAHPAVVEVIQGDLYDPGRERAEWYLRQLLLNSARRFAGDSDWFAYFDADEQLIDFPREVLDEPNLTVVATNWCDVYITPDDVAAPYQSRDWVDYNSHLIPHFFKNDPVLRYNLPDQRIMHHAPPAVYPRYGYTRHYGLGFSEEIFDRKVEYYKQWPKYAAKWEIRKGRAVRCNFDSVTGVPLRRLSEIRGTE